MILYVHVARRAFRRFSTYRAATFAAFVENTVIGVARAYVWLAVVRHRPEVGSMDASEVVTYAFMAQAAIASLQPTWETEIVERIRTGDVVTDLYRPVDFQLWWLANEAGRTVFQTLTRGIPPVVLGAVVFDLDLPSSLAVWTMFGLSVCLAFLVVFGWRFLVSLTGFWLLDTRGVLQLSAGLYTFCSGSLVPLAFMPDALADVLRWLPFAAMLQLPIEVLLQQGDVVGILAVQAMWAVALLALGRVVLRRAVGRLVVQGG